MEEFKFVSKSKISQLPKTAGVYALKNKGELLYLGKAANIRNRVKNHFQQPSFRDNLFLDKTKKIGYIETDSEIEALLSEAKLIKKYQPKYNILWRDDKNYFYIQITKEDLPRVFLTHQPKTKDVFIGPFVEGAPLKKTLRVLRKIFPYFTVKKHPKGPCPFCHIGFCPGPKPNPKEYKKNIKNLIAVLKGKKKSVLKSLEKKMETFSKKQEYEKAAKIRGQIFALERVMAHAKIIKPPLPEDNWDKAEKTLRKITKTKQRISQIEAYDVSNIQGRQAAGSMVVFINGQSDKNFYRKFKIKLESKPNDIAMIKEVLKRRFSHPEWDLPDLILIDGGKAQLNVAVNVKCQMPNVKSVRILALAKRKNELYIEGQRRPVLLKKLPREIFNLILQLRDEAHRFARAYHHKLREIDLQLKT